MISRIVANTLNKRQIIRKISCVSVKRLLYNTNCKLNSLTFPKNINTDHVKRHYTRMPKTPDLIYVPQVIRWLKAKFQLKYLQKTWDPEFTEGAFIYGTSKAICRITQIIHEDIPEELDDLMTMSARSRLKHDMKARLTKGQKTIIQIQPGDIKILVPTNVSFKKEGAQKNCRVGMKVLALKWIQPKKGPLRLVLIALQTEFLRDYNQPMPDWTISAFDILECAVLTQTPH